MFFEQEHSLHSDYLRLWQEINENFSFPLHLHSDCEFIYVEDGILRVEINNCAFDIRSGEGALILPNQPHEFMTHDYSRSWGVIFSIDYVPRLKSFIAQNGYFSPHIKPNDASLNSKFLEARSNTFKICSLLYRIAALYSEGEPTPEIELKDNAPVCRIVEYISTHYTERMTLEEMARALGYSYRYMSGVVNRFFKQPLPQVVNRYRVNYAYELLSNTDKDITEVALLCGFGSIRNFNRNFKLLTDMSPQEYRAQNIKHSYYL